MAMTTCKECNREISTKAESCPSCGAKAPKRTSMVTWLVGGLFALVVFSVALGGRGGGGQPAADATPPDPAAAAAAKAQRERTVAAAATLKLLKGAMRDPDSVKWESVRANSTATVVCVEYRARNGFGGMNRSFAVMKDGKLSDAVSAWNKHCAQSLLDETDTAQQLLAISGG